MNIEFNASENKFPLKFYDIGLEWIQHKVYRPHGFPYYHWLQTDKGVGLFKIGQQEITLSAHQGLLMRPNVSYSCYPDTDKLWVSSFLTFEGTMADSLASFLGLNDFQVYDNLDPCLDNFIQKNYITFHRYDYVSSLEQSLLLYQFLMQLKKNAYLNKLDFSQNQVVNAVVGYIREHYQEKISNSGLVSVTGYSAPHTIRMFKAEVGITPMEYLDRFRLRMAKTLIDFRSDLSIEEISNLVGYTNVSYFIQRYKKVFKMTPGKEKHNIVRI